eukprot:1206065-Rhodomonas_salina.4
MPMLCMWVYERARRSPVQPPRCAYAVQGRMLRHGADWHCMVLAAHRTLLTAHRTLLTAHR